MGAYRDAVNADGVYVHYELNNDYSDSEGLVPTDGSYYGGSTSPVFSTPSFVKGGAGYHLDARTPYDRGVFVSKVDADLASNLDDNDELSIELWFKPEVIRTSGAQVNNLIRHDTNLWWLRLVNGYLQMVVSTDLAGGSGFTDTTTQLSSGNIYHLVGTYDGADNKIRLYVNGSLVGTSSAITGNYLSFPTNSAWTYIGSPGTETMDGEIDEIAIYRKVLSLAEIQDHYDIGRGYATINATVTDIDVAGKTATVSAGSDAIVSVTVSDIDIAGQAATVTATAPNAVITADVTDINVDEQIATVIVTADVDTESTITNIDIAGLAATITVEQNNTQTADVSNIDIAGKDVNIVISVEATVTNIDLTGQPAAVSAGGNIQIIIDATNLDIDGQPATVVISSTINAGSTNVAIAGKDSLNLYPSIVIAKNPLHYWKFDLQATQHVVKDFGSSVINGALVQVSGDNASTTNLTSSSFVGNISGDYGSNSVKLLGSVSGTTSASYRQRVQFTGYQPTTIGANLTYELWFKTTNSYAELLVFDSPDYESSVYFVTRKTTLGLLNGKLSTWQMSTNETAWDKRTNIVSTSASLNDGNWHHVMLTKSTSGGISTFKSYIDGVQTSTTLSLGNLLVFAELTTARDYVTGTYTVSESDTLFYIGNAFGAVYGGTAGSSYNVTVDDVAIYQSALTAQDAINRYGTGTGSTDIQVTVTTTDINIDSTTTSTSTIVNVTKTNIKTRAGSPQVSDGSNVLIISNQNNIGLTGFAPSTSFDASKTILQTAGVISVNAQQTRIRTAILDFKFVPAGDTSLSAADAETLTELNFLGLLFNQTKKLLFRIGNTDSVKSTFDISVTSKNTDLLNAISLSYDDITYSNALTIQNVESNTITECIYIKFDSNIVNYLGAGTFLINVEKTNE